MSFKNIFKKTVTLTYLTAILFSLFFPFNQINAQTNPFTISVDKSNIKIGEISRITVLLNAPTAGGESVSFTGGNFNLDPAVCIFPNPPKIQSCSVNFNPIQEGTFQLNANVIANDKSYQTEDTSIIVKGCLDPKKIISNGLCTTPTTLVPGDNTTSGTTDTTYNPLAPLPGLDTTIDTAGTCPFGNYLNIMIKLVIGISAVLAMVMIVMGGIEYMTSDLISSKEAGKETIKNALLGLFIALGAYLILNTINPKLLSACLDNLPKAEIVIDEAPPTAADFNPNEKIPNGAIKSCPEGITKINTSGGYFTVCKKIANNIQSAINKAWSEGYKISGWGWRSYETQKNLRIKNGCPDIYTSPPNKCRIPTAIPGTSMHESGLAVDLTCDGVSIQTHDNKCYIWLKNNINIHKLINLKSEAWHWSINGH